MYQTFIGWSRWVRSNCAVVLQSLCFDPPAGLLENAECCRVVTLVAKGIEEACVDVADLCNQPSLHIGSRGGGEQGIDKFGAFLVKVV